MRILANLYPGGKKAALTFSYDDGQRGDERLVSIFNKYGMKGTFHLNAYRLDKLSFDDNPIQAEEVKELYAGHEVSCHMYSHPFPSTCPDTMLVNQIMEDRKVLEKACGYTVRGMSYPFGEWTDKSIDIFKACGMQYARTTNSTKSFSIPRNFMEWHPTCHHKDNLVQLFDALIERTKRYVKHDVMYVWGHSYEFDRENNWEIIENFCEYASGRDDIWYATNIEIYDYITASNNLMVGVDGKTVYNPSNISVWVTEDKKTTPIEIKPGHNVLA